MARLKDSGGMETVTSNGMSTHRWRDGQSIKQEALLTSEARGLLKLCASQDIILLTMDVLGWVLAALARDLVFS
jgi:hypothetical protein